MSSHSVEDLDGVTIVRVQVRDVDSPSWAEWCVEYEEYVSTLKTAAFLLYIDCSAVVAYPLMFRLVSQYLKSTHEKWGAYAYATVLQVYVAKPRWSMTANLLKKIVIDPIIYQLGDDAQKVSTALSQEDADRELSKYHQELIAASHPPVR